MADLEIITNKARSEGAKRMWKRRKELMNVKNVTMDYPIRPWNFQAQWWTLVCGLAGSFVFFFLAFTQMNNRLDDHIKLAVEMNKDQSSRTDELHKEFYELLKEMRAGRG